MKYARIWRGFARRHASRFKVTGLCGGLGLSATSAYRVSQRSFVAAASESDKNQPQKYDLIVIGGGSAGIASAKRAAEYGAL